MRNHALASFATTFLVCGPLLWGQRAPSVQTSGVVNPVATAPSTDNITGTQTMIINRARVLKDKANGEGTRYFAVRDSDLAGKKPAEINQILAPTPVTPQQKVRTMDVIVDLDHPLFIKTTAKDPFAIGTTIVEGKVSDLLVDSDITLGELKITNRN